MAQSTFAAEATQFIDGMAPEYAPAGLWNLGVQFLGTSKMFARRCLAGFDLFGTAVAGRPLLPADAITSAELALETITVTGPGGWAAKVERVTRPDWDYLTANWNRYRTGANWTAGGGDVGTPPAAVTFTSPSVAGEHVIAGTEAFVTDAIASRDGKVLLRLKADVEDPSQSQWCAYDAVLVSSARPRLRVTYIAAEPADIDNPEGVSLLGEVPQRGEAIAFGEPVAAPDAPSRPAEILRFAQDDMTDEW